MEMLESRVTLVQPGMASRSSVPKRIKVGYGAPLQRLPIIILLRRTHTHARNDIIVLKKRDQQSLTRARCEDALSAKRDESQEMHLMHEAFMASAARHGD